MTSPRRSVFFANLGVVVSYDAVTGEVAQKVTGSMPRYVWYLAAQYHNVVLSSPPPQDFLDYVRSFGLTTNVFVPEGLDQNQLSLLDGFNDPALQELVRDADVDSYVPDEQLARLVEHYGGRYVPCGSNAVTDLVGDKGAFPNLVAPLLHVPPGSSVAGIRNIAELVQNRLTTGQGSFVRLHRAGGGLGNREFRLMDWLEASLPEILKYLGGPTPDLWQHNPARVEDILELEHTFGVAFAMTGEMRHSTLQITRGSSFYGCWLPCPPWIYHPDQFLRIVRELSPKLTAMGYTREGQIDLGSLKHGGNVCGFEFNARMTGGLHMRLIAEMLVGPYQTWANAGIAVRGVDVVHLRANYTLAEVLTALRAEKVLASRGNPFGVVVSIPPDGNALDPTVGLVAIGHGIGTDGYLAAQQYYNRALRRIGHATRNYEDRPLFETSKEAH